MLVSECIQNIKDKNSRNPVHKVTRLWICPQIVPEPKIGKEYVIETGINNSIPESLYDTEVKKHWIENGDCLSIIFKVPGYPEGYKTGDVSFPEY